MTADALVTHRAKESAIKIVIQYVIYSLVPVNEALCIRVATYNAVCAPRLIVAKEQ